METGGARRGRGRRLALLIGATVVATVLPLSAARAEDPLFANWPDLLPGLTSGHDPSDANDCKAGRIQCVDSIVREMDRRLGFLAKECSHNAVFGLAYLRTTEEYRRAVLEPDFFADPGFLNHYDAVFARYYFDAVDDWYQRNKRDRVAPAWRVAFEASDAKAVTGTGSMLLGISAHINRDLPFVLAEIGLVAPDGISRKADHNKVNEFLDRVDFYEEARDRFDPSMSGSGAPGGIHLVIGWREQAWRAAERLVAATTSEERAQVAAGIETAAYLEALTIQATTAYGLLQSSAARDAHCAANGLG